MYCVLLSSFITNGGEGYDWLAGEVAKITPLSWFTFCMNIFNFMKDLKLFHQHTSIIIIRPVFEDGNKLNKCTFNLPFSKIYL